MGLSSTTIIVGCDIKGIVNANQALEHWDDCPAVSDDFDIAWSFITTRVELLVNRLAETGGVRQP